MYPLKLHPSLTPKKWSKYSTDRQIFMIANEFNRLMNGIRDFLPFDALRETIERAFELLDLTISSQEGFFRYELLRFREIFGNFYLLSREELQNSLPEIGQFYRVLLFMNSKTSVLN